MASYKKNYLKQVIFRIDFEEVGFTKVNGYLDKVSTVFPKKERKIGYESQVTVSFADGPPKQQQVNNPITIWNLSDDEGIKRAELTPKWFWVEYSSYKDSVALVEDIKTIFDIFIDEFEIKVINRVGLRYANVITPPETTKPTDWGKYINADLIAGIKFAKDNSASISRYMGQLIKHTEDHDIQFNYGIWNPDFPNQIARKEFILDIDCYSTLPMDTRDFTLSNIAKQFNIEIENIFEASILEPLRTLMGKV